MGWAVIGGLNVQTVMQADRLLLPQMPPSPRGTAARRLRTPGHVALHNHP
jgi:hypothetical protein